MITLREFILHGNPNGLDGNGIEGKWFRDVGTNITIKTSEGLKFVPSPHKGQKYLIGGITNYISWNPNNLRTTLVVVYPPENGEVNLNNVEFTYLDERFNDEFIEQD